MKKTLIFGLVSILLLPLLMIGCNTEENKTIELTLDDFTAQNNIVKNVELAPSGTLTVSLGANPTTGYEWGENAVISGTSVITQQSYNYNEPQSESSEPVVGAAGKAVWVFDSKAAGTATIKMSYGRPWEAGEKGTFTLTINVTVK